MSIAILAAASGFLLAVLWMDLMFDVQVLRHREASLPDPVLGSIAAYYRRVTTDASPMGRLVGVVMVSAIAAAVARIAGGGEPQWSGWVSLALCAPPVVLAQTRIFPFAVRLGTRQDTVPEQSRLARAICTAHLVCFAAMLALLTLQLWLAATP